jgi:hypothetical protein
LAHRSRIGGGLAHAADPLQTTDHVAVPAATDASAGDADERRSDFPAVPGYRVLGEIARGGMGRVLAAYDFTLDRDVAGEVAAAPASRSMHRAV